PLGLVIMCCGLLVELVVHLLKLKYLGMWSFVAVVSGGVLALHGVEVWPIVRFPVLYMLAAGPLPSLIYGRPSGFIQRVSTFGAAETMQTLGYTLVRTGNYISIPNLDLEVADVCSGFKKYVALVAFGLLYSYLFRISWKKRLIIILMAGPIAAVANVIRICILIAVSTRWGRPALDLMHDPAEVLVLLIALALFVLTGKVLGCNTTRFSQQ
ncbi:MAG TPA: exosortase/archaeosortase family protein, partial [Chthonomonadales bacterium]|nr:exosortase/archaeosortase family protein [Chthonomonadales bacterium]